MGSKMVLVTGARRHRQGHRPERGHDGCATLRSPGQEREERRQEIWANPPDILLTNFAMLELILTRTDERHPVEAGQGLEFLVLDELHTYRGRQGADVAMLVRRVRDRSGAPSLRCVGTSASLASQGTREQRQADIAGVAQRLFGLAVPPRNVVLGTPSKPGGGA